MPIYVKYLIYKYLYSSMHGRTDSCYHTVVFVGLHASAVALRFFHMEGLTQT